MTPESAAYAAQYLRDNDRDRYLATLVLPAKEREAVTALYAFNADIASVRELCSAVSRPINFMVGIPRKSFPIRDLAAAGVRRISLSTSLYRAAMTGFLSAIREIREAGEFTFLDRTVSTAELITLMNA